MKEWKNLKWERTRERKNERKKENIKKERMYIEREKDATWTDMKPLSVSVNSPCYVNPRTRPWIILNRALLFRSKLLFFFFKSQNFFPSNMKNGKFTLAHLLQTLFIYYTGWVWSHWSENKTKYGEILPKKKN